jgi:SSS family solute:Na+ symporter
MITALDLFVVILYLLIVFIIATVFSRGQGVEGFLVNSRATKLLFLVVSIVSTNVGAGFFLSVAAEAYTTGISFGVTIIIISTVMSLTFAAVCGKVKRIADDGNVHTIPELLNQRYRSDAVGIIAACITIAGYLFVTALQFVGIGAIASVISGYDFSKILLIAGIMTVVYTAIGGLRSDFIADALSFVIMTIILLLIVPLIISSGRINFTALPPSHMDIFAFAGVPFFVISILLAVVSSFMFMELWQRVFAAESPETARKAFLISGLIQPFLIGAGILLGLTASLLYTQTDKNVAIFRLMVEFLPRGILGLGLVAVLAILMTTVNSLVLVGGSTLFTDIVKRKLGRASERSQLWWVRSLTIVFGLCALTMAFILPDLVRLLLMGAFVMMPMCPAIIWSFFKQRPSSSAAIISMVAGIAVTVVLLPRMPDTAFGPGFFVSLVVLIIGYYYQKLRVSRKSG